MTTTTSPAPSFAADFAGLIPPELRPSAATLSRREFLDSYCPDGGPVRLGSWSQQPGPRGTQHFDATIGIGSRVRTVHVDAIGPIAALSGALHDAGFGIEILSFHQQQTDEGTVTFVHCEHEGRRHWAMGIADSDTDSALRSIVAAANLLS